MPTPAPGSAESLYQDPSAAYQPALEAIAKQEAAANQRYAENKADLKNIFGSLSTLSAADSARIQEQFTQTIADQRMGLASRTAEARAGVAANQQAMQTVGAERGQGPAMVASPVAAEAEAGIGRANAYQQTWEGLLGANKTQASADTLARQQGYALQQQDALTRLNQMLQDQMLALETQKYGIMGNQAQAQMGAKQTVLNAKYQEAQDALARQRAAVAASTAAANKPKTYEKSVVGWTSKVTDLFGPAAASAMRGEVANAVRAIQAGDTTRKVSASEVINRLSSMSKYKGDPGLAYAIDYVNKYSGLSR